MNEELQELKRQLEAERRVSASFTSLSKAIISPVLTRSDIYQMVLDQAREMTSSDHGFVSSVDQTTGSHVSHTLTKMKAEGCSAPLTEGVLPRGPHKRYESLWGNGLNTREAFFTNNPAKHPSSRGLPEGHVPMKNFLSVPVVFHEMLLGQIALSNSTRDYTQADIEIIEKLAVFYAVVLRNHLWGTALQDANATLEQKVAARTQELLAANKELIEQYEKSLAMQEKNMLLNQELATMNEELERLVVERTSDVTSANRELTGQYEELAEAERKVRRSGEIQTVLREIAEAALLSPSMGELYATVHHLVGRVLPAKLFHINLLDESTNEIVVPFRADVVTFIPQRRPVDKGMTEYIMQLGRAVHVTPDEMDRLIATGEYTLANVQNVKRRHYLGAPLIDSSGKAFGVMSLILQGETQSFQPEDAELLSIIAAQVSLAIERKRMEEELKIQATIDGLTGIFNRRHFMDRAEEELHRIARYEGTCSMLMLDIDHFKNVNDNFGHAVGDAALRKVAGLCAESLRGTDLLGRIGGEEFAMILIETGVVEATQVAERLRLRIQDYDFRTAKDESVPLRGSIGVAERQFGDESLAALMIRADGALYRAKHEGRNKVVTV